MWHKPFLSLCNYEWCQSHFGEERNSALTKLPLLVQLITETFILLVIFFSCDALPDLMFAASAWDVFTHYLSLANISPSVFPGLLQTLWTPLSVTSLLEWTKSMVWQPECFGTHQLKWNRSTSTLFQALKGTRGVRVRGKNSLMYERQMD